MLIQKGIGRNFGSFFIFAIMINNNKIIIASLLSFLIGLLLYSFTSCIVTLFGHFLHKQLNIVFWEIGFERIGIELILVSINFVLAIFFYKQNPKLFTLFSCLLWIVLFVAYVIKNTVNIPISDDYHYFLLFLNDYSASHNFSMILQQEAESRMVIIHLISVLLFHFNIFNFKILTLISSVCLIGIALLFYRSILAKQKEFLFLIIVLLLFQFQYYNSVFVPSDALYSTCTIFYVFCSLYFLNKNSKWMFTISLLSILLAALNCGSGFAGFIAGMTLLITQKRTKRLYVWLVFSACISIAFFINYAFINETIFSSANILELLNKLFKSLLFSFTFLGSPFQFLYQITLPIIAGSIIWLFFIFLTVKKYFKINPVIYFMLLFLIMSSVLPSLFRSDYQIHSAISIRYGVYAITAISCCIIAYFEISTVKNRLSAMKYLLVISFCYHLSTNLFFYPEVVIRKQRLEAFIRQIKNKSPLIVPPHTPCTAEEAESIINESASKNIYKIPDE